MESPEYRALRRGSSLLKSGINPDDIVSLLSDHDLLTPDERCRANATNLTAPKRMEEVHSALERRVIVRWEAFHTILAILKSVPALGPVAEELHRLYKKEGGTRPLAVDIPTPDPIIPAAPAEAAGESNMVLPHSSLPRNVVAPQSSYRHAQPSSDVGSSGPTSSMSSFQNTTGDMPSGSTDTYARDETPVQDSEQDRNKSEMHCPSPPSQWSEGFIVYSKSVHSEAIEAGVSPSSSRQLKYLMQELKHKSSELEFANKELEFATKRISLLESRTCELERIGHSELELANKQRDLFKSRVCDLTKHQEKDREEHESEIAEMLKRIEGMQLECRANTEQCKALKEENETLRKENETLRKENETLKKENETTLKEAQQRAAAVEKCEEFEERKTRVRRLSEEYYDTMLQLDYALQSVLDKEGVDEEFKKKMRELKKEVEERKL